jgi:hypothetical protein
MGKMDFGMLVKKGAIIMKLIIAEKPDQGSTLASIFKHKKQNGFIEIFANDVFLREPM